MQYKTIFILLITTGLWGASHATLHAQILYATAFDISIGQIRLYKIDVATCEICPVSNLIATPPSSITGTDLVVLPNGNLLSVNQNDGTYLFNPPNAVPIGSFPNQWFEGTILAPNGLVYLSGAVGNFGLSSFNPANNTFTFIGPWPANINVGEMFYWNGVLYGSGVNFSTGQQVLVEVNVTNPDQSNIIQNTVLVAQDGTASITSGPGQGIYSISAPWPNQQLSLYDIATNSFSPICSFGTGIIIEGLTSLPPGVTPDPCLCISNAGSVSNNTLNLCIPTAATVPFNNNATLDNNDLLRYILFTNPNNLPGSIVATSTTPNIPFNPATMQPNVTYYLGTMAGNNLNGNIDPTDPCLDFSNTDATVIWKPTPTVSFSVPNLNLCEGNCKAITATFTGTPPFSLTYTTPAGTFSQTFSGNTGTIQVCAPAGSAPGPLSVQATSLTDMFCSCQ